MKKWEENAFGKRGRGLFVVFLGPDGSGKSSVIDAVRSSLPPSFTGSFYFHLRPRIGLTQAPTTTVTNPHAEAPRGLIGSTAKLFYFLVDYWLGYFLKIKPQLLSSALVIFDRYFYDLLIDPKRYRYGGAMWFASLLSRVVPKPDMIILLDAPPQQLQARKSEVPFGETLRQREVYLDFVRKHANGFIIDASRPFANVVQEVRVALSIDQKAQAQ